jgi:hypothetical protein
MRRQRCRLVALLGADVQREPCEGRHAADFPHVPVHDLVGMLFHERRRRAEHSGAHRVRGRCPRLLRRCRTGRGPGHVCWRRNSDAPQLLPRRRLDDRDLAAGSGRPLPVDVDLSRPGCRVEEQTRRGVVSRECHCRFSFVVVEITFFVCTRLEKYPSSPPDGRTVRAPAWGTADSRREQCVRRDDHFHDEGFLPGTEAGPDAVQDRHQFGIVVDSHGLHAQPGGNGRNRHPAE